MKKKNLRVYKHEFIDLYKYGYSLREIGTMYDVSKASVKKYIVEDMDLRQRGLSDKQKEKAKELYTSGLSVFATANALGADNTTVKHFLSKEFGTVTDGVKKYDHLKDILCKEYANGLSANEVAKKYGISRSTVLSYVAQEGNDIRTYSETSRLYGLNEDYFDVIDSNNAFILGIFISRGRLNNMYTNYFTDLSLPDERREVLETVINEIYTDDKANSFNKVDNTLKLRVSSKKLYDRLKELGITHKNVEGKLELHPDILPYQKEFYKGVFYSNASFTSRYVSLSMYREYLSVLEDYIKSLDIFSYKIVGASVQVEANKEVIKLISEFNILLPILKSKVNTLEKEGKKHSWGTVLNYFNEK